MRELDIILAAASNARATDIHIGESIIPRMRVDTELLPMKLNIPVSMETLFEQIMQSLKPKERDIMLKKFAENKDLDCAFTAFNGNRVRVNVYRSENGLSAALRIIPHVRLSMENIGLPFYMASICKTKSGLFIVSGASGSGKTTTIAAIIDSINDNRNVHIITIEDPVEYVFQSKRALISQREIGLHSPSFYDALRSSMRENPDIIVLGEMRDIETARTAIELAETGHLVFATLHTRTSISTVDRLIGQFPPAEQRQIRLMLSDNLLGVLSQTLLPKSGGGLIAAFELLIANHSIRNLIREEKLPQIYSVLQTGRSQGMMTMEDSLLAYVERGIVSPSDALLKAPMRSQFLEMMRNSQKINASLLRNLY